MGRRLKGERKKTKQVCFRMTEKEYEEARKYATLYGYKTVQSYITAVYREWVCRYENK